MAENTPEANSPKDVAKAPKEPELTEQNWLMLKYLREGKRIREAYTLAGYEGNGDACYKMYHVIKGKLKEIVEVDGFNKTRLAIEMEKLISLPLESTKTEVTLGEKLKSIRLANQILTEDAQKAPQSQFTMIVIENQPIKKDEPTVIDVPDLNVDNGPSH